jgi:hypothetical protein
MMNTPKPPRMNTVVMRRSPHRATVDKPARFASQIQAILSIKKRPTTEPLNDPLAQVPPSAPVDGVVRMPSDVKGDYRARRRLRFPHSGLS